jgi:hypothetical protein
LMVMPANNKRASLQNQTHFPFNCALKQRS